MAEKKYVDLRATKTFFDPHPGFAGAAIPIPAPVKRVAEELDGQTMTLGEAVERLRAVSPGRIVVVAEYDYIALYLGDDDRLPRHVFRVIRYR